MQVRVLGPLEVTDAGRSLHVSGTRTRALLALLAVHAGEVVDRDRLIEELWGAGTPANAVNALQARISQLRRLLGTERLVGRARGYALVVDPGDVDAVAFERQARQGRAALAEGRVDEAAATLQRALELWRGPALVDLVAGDTAAIEAPRLEELRLATLEDRVEADLALGRHAQLIAELGAIVTEHPLRERPRGQLMVALYRAGRQADALRSYQDARTMLAEELGLDPGPELARLEAAILAHAPEIGPPGVTSVPSPDLLDAPAPARPAGNLRASLTSFVGRHEDRSRVHKLLDECRLVTLTGPGGSGKTRLANEVGTDLSGSFPGGVWMVELAGVADASAVTSTVASTLGLRDGPVLPVAGAGAGDALAPLAPLPRLLGRLDGTEALLILDNCEHVVGEVAHLAEALLGSCPTLRILATSREPLGVAGEAQWPLAPLAVPAAEVEAPEELAASAAVQLFGDRAAAVLPGFTLSATTAPDVAEICRRLDGLPLAIELAAAKVKSLPLPEIVERLHDRFRLLGRAPNRAPRQQTLRALVDWSYDLLDDDERRAFESLSAFAGGATLEAAEEVCADGDLAPPQVVDVLVRLVDKSLVVADLGHRLGPRYELLETLRQYGQEKLASSGRAGEVHLRHGQHFLALAEAGALGVRGHDQRRWLDRLDDDHDNLRAALDRAVARRDSALALPLARALGWFWYLHGPRQEALDRLEEVLALPVGSPLARAGTMGWAGFLAFCSLDLPRASAWCEENLELCRQTGDEGAIALAQGLCALVEMHLGSLERARVLLAEASARFGSAGDDWGVAAIEFVASTLAVADDVERGEALASAALGRFRALGDDWGILRCLSVLGQGAEVREDYPGAVAHLTEACRLARSLGLPEESAGLQGQLANIDVLRGARDRDEWLEAELASPSGRFGLVWVAYYEDRLGVAARARGDVAQARSRHEQALAIHLAVGLDDVAALTLARLGVLAELGGDVIEARQRHAQALHLVARGGPGPALALGVEGMAALAAADGDAERAATLLGAGAAVRDAARCPLPASERGDVDRAERRARAALGDDAFARAEAHGRSLPVHEAVALALG